jgi:hypothetical protein
LGDSLRQGRTCAGIAKLSKSRKSHCRYQTANVVVTMLAAWGHLGQGKNGGRSRKPREDRRDQQSNGHNENWLHARIVNAVNKCNRDFSTVTSARSRQRCKVNPTTLLESLHARALFPPTMSRDRLRFAGVLSRFTCRFLCHVPQACSVESRVWTRNQYSG